MPVYLPVNKVLLKFVENGMKCKLFNVCPDGLIFEVNDLELKPIRDNSKEEMVNIKSIRK